MNKIDVAGLKIDSISKAELLSALGREIAGGKNKWLITAYSETLLAGLKDRNFMEILNAADLTVADGVGIFWAKKYLELPLTAKSYWAKILQALWQIKYSLAAIIFYPQWIKTALPEKIVGADLVWDLAELAAKNGWSVYLLGGFGNTPKLAKDKLKTKNPSLKIAGWSNKNPNDLSTLEEINRSQADVLLIAYGSLGQEKWIFQNRPKLKVKLVVGLGGTFDYITGGKLNPPKLLRFSGLEWLWRLLTQPYRLKRIFNATFGLAFALWHYKVFMSLPLRRNAAVVILNSNNQVLLCQRNPKNFHVDIIKSQANLRTSNYWQLPQGGLRSDEDLIQAAKREALEETGIKNLELIKISPQTNTYVWNNAARRFWKNRKYANKGQTQNLIYFKFFSQDNEIKLDNHELINYQWAKIENLDKIVHPERLNLIKIVQEDLKDLTKNGKI